eukprot:2539746-Pyramimonas_sp.AAC.1
MRAWLVDGEAARGTTMWVDSGGEHLEQLRDGQWSRKVSLGRMHNGNALQISVRGALGVAER